MEQTNRNPLIQHAPLLSVLMLGMFLAVLNQTLLNVAIPQFINQFQITASTAEWLLTGYMLINGILIPLSPYFIERFGMRKLFMMAMLIFTIGSLICGIAPTFAVLLTGRLIQAVGAGVMMPLVMAIILDVFPPEVRGKGMGIFGLGIMFAPAIGPTLSGWLMEHYSWRVLFYGIAPLGIIVIILAWFHLKEVQQERKTKLDVWGATTSTLGFGLFLYGLSKAGSSGWLDPLVISILIFGILMIALFIWQQLRSAQPILDFRIFKYDMFSLSTVINMIITISMFSGMFLLPIYLQNLRGFTPFEAGLLMLPAAIIMGVMSPISGALFDKIGPKWLAIVGMLITVVTTFQFSHLTLQTSYETIMILNSIRAFGMSLLMMPITTAGLNQLPKEKNTHGTAMSNTMRQVSGSMGISLFTSIFTIRSEFHVGQLTTSTEINLVQAQQQAAVSGIDDAFFLAAIVASVGLLLSLFLRDVRKDKKKEPVQPITPTNHAAKPVEKPLPSS